MEDKTHISHDDILAALSQYEGWFIDGILLKKTFQFDNYKDINQFLPYYIKTIVSLNHHPDFSFDSGAKTVTMQVTTHSEGCLTQADLDLALALENWRQS